MPPASSLRSSPSSPSPSPFLRILSFQDSLEERVLSPNSRSDASSQKPPLNATVPFVPDEPSSTSALSVNEPSATDRGAYLRQGREDPYAVTPRYREWALAEERKPDIRFVDSSQMGSSTMGQHFIGTNLIWINNAPQFAPYIGEVIKHERGHYYCTDPTVSHAENEIRNRLYTYSVTRDSTQLAFGAYHP